MHKIEAHIAKMFDEGMTTSQVAARTRMAQAAVVAMKKIWADAKVTKAVPKVKREAKS